MKDIDFNCQTEVKINEPLSKHSSFCIGGNANFAFFPKSKEQLIEAVESCKRENIEFKIIGKGSNILFDDNGYNGAIIFTSGVCSTEYIYKTDHVVIIAECGKSITELSAEAGKKHCLTGLEFSYGIPGTVGGAVFMNAGAYGGQMSDLVLQTEYYDTVSKEIRVVRSEEHDFDYRHTIFMTHPEYIILSTTLKLTVGNAEEIFNAMSRNMTSRKEKQPLEYPSAGSTFKRPGNGLFAGKLIEDANLKGFSIGKAQVSQKHAGFVINIGGATSSDVLALIDHVKKTVKDKFDVTLECEMIYIPYQ